MIASTAARPWSCCAPTMAKKISVDSTSKLPPSTSGLPKSARLSMKPSRKALASPGRISGKRHGGERGPGVGAQRLRRLLQRRADPLDHADQHQEGDRRERQGLREPQARQAVDPAARLDADHRLPELGDRARAAEQQDDREPDDEGRGDDRQHGQHPQQALGAKAGPRDHEREGEAQRGRPGAGQHGQQQRVPGDPAAPAAGEAAEAPDPGVQELGEEQARRQRTVIVVQRAAQHASASGRG